ncbi:MAG: SufE family protein [Chitinophagales bacterium]|nr:SufE family protein [Chitinophagales bacterium]MDW8273865.1 SufE family protein [Chitinophagales bacterium]
MRSNGAFVFIMMTKENSIEEREAAIIETFDGVDDVMERYELIIDYGKKLSPLPDQYKKDEYLVKGCQSKVWLHAYFKDGKIYYEADTNTAITKGIVAMLIEVLSGQPPKAIVEAPLHFIEAIQLRSHLSSQRSNGLTAMIQRMKAYAASYL